MTYRDIQHQPWSQILAEAEWKWHPPVTVHLPIQPAHSPDFVHVDSALNAIRRRVLPDMSVRSPESLEQIRKVEVLAVQFALDDPPFVPDFRQSRLSLGEGRYPVATADYSAWDLLYEFEYACGEVEEPEQSVLSIRGRVTNEGEKPAEAHVRIKVSVQPENEFCDYHYVPFYWDATKWRACDRIALESDRILLDGRDAGCILPGEFACEWEKEAQFEGRNFNSRFGYGTPYFVVPALRLERVDHAIHLHRKLAPGEHAGFEIRLLVNFEQATEAQGRRVTALEAGAVQRHALEHFRGLAAGGGAVLECPANAWERAFAEAQVSTQQLLVRFPGRSDLVPTQGGTSERHFVWVWEAAYMLMPMLKLGHFAPVRQALDYIFSLQDGGCPPEGKLTTTKGAIGTTGPRWLSTTGCGLALAADYARYSHDPEFQDAYLPRMLRGADWIAGEIRATRTPNADGSRPLTYGLMPFGHATDGDVGCIIAITDAYTFWGLEKTVHLLESLGHARAAEFRTLLEEYRCDLAAAIQGVTRADGYIDRKIRMGSAEEIIYLKFDLLCNASHLAFCGALPVEGPQFQRFMDFIETRYADGYFMGRMDRDVMYVGINEAVWQELYLRLGQWKKAFAAVRSSFMYSMTQDTFQVQERFSKRDPAYTPWQPNGSGNGRLLDMIIKSFYFDYGGEVTLLGNIPFEWLRRNGRTALQCLRTPEGSVSIEAEMLDGSRCRVSLSGAPAAAMPRAIRFPEHFAVSSAHPAARAESPGRFGVSPVGEVEFLVTDAAI